MNTGKLLLVVCGVIVGIAVIGLGLGALTTLLAERFGSTTYLLFVLLLGAGSLIALRRQQRGERAERLQAETGCLVAGRLLFADRAAAFESFYHEYLRNDKHQPIEALEAFASGHGYALSLDWRGEEDEGELEAFVEARLGNAPAFTHLARVRQHSGDADDDGTLIIRLLQALDKDLRSAGQQLLLLDLGSDSYHLLLTDSATFRTITRSGTPGFQGTQTLRAGADA